ncbi:MAG: pilin [Candidatus Paceibacterota bacterium]
MKKKLFTLFGLSMMLAPVVAFGQVTGAAPTRCEGGAITDLQSLLCKFNELLGALLPFLIALGVLYFVWGVVSYMIADDEEAKSAGRNRVIYGIIGLVVIVGMWGLVRLVTNTFGLNNTSNITFPTVPY